MAAALASLARPFRERYLSYADLEAQLRAWADAYPDLVRLTTLGKTASGFPMKVPTMLGSLTADQVKTAPKIVGDNAKAIKNLATNIDAITGEVTGIFDDITTTFK